MKDKTFTQALTKTSIKTFSNRDNFIIKVDQIIKSIFDTRQVNHQQINPQQYENLTKNEIKASIGMMRVNHSGEVCAQALYLGQALTAKDDAKRKFLLHAASEEKEHLAWCNERLKELNGRTSFFNPIWFCGSFVLGALAGLCGDKFSFGFLAETEYQVTSHLEQHLNQISVNDIRSRAIITQMKTDELAHATSAITNGGVALPKSVKVLMHCTAKLMTTTANYI